MYAHQAMPGPRPRVLVIDDEQPVLDAAKSFLTAHGFDVDTAAEREEAEALLCMRGYGLVIADLCLTGVHGREGLELVRVAREQCPVARIILITAYGTADLELEVLRKGSDMLLEKPIPLSELLAAARRLLDMSPSPVESASS
jgi:two-component system response regulator AtoC